MDFKNYDKNGNPLNLIPLAKRDKQANHYQKWLEDPAAIEPSKDDIKCELQLQALDTWEQLSIKIKRSVQDELKEIEEYWVPYLRREGTMNDREGISLFSYPGLDMNDGLSMPEVVRKVGHRPSETLFTEPTIAYDKLPSIHPLVEYFSPVGRTFLVRVNAGGYFPPHKDTPLLIRDTFRVVAFLSNQDILDDFEWEMDGRILPISQFSAYYCDTRKTHRTHSWRHNCVHLIMNIPKTWENVIKLMSITKRY